VAVNAFSQRIRDLPVIDLIFERECGEAKGLNPKRFETHFILFQNVSDVKIVLVIARKTLRLLRFV
jgi:hypothetical protein